jgi:hypothetical protein
LADAVSFEQVVERHGGKIDLLKVDCEGSEYRIILDSPVAAWRGIENVLLEYHPDPRHSWSDIALFLEDQGFDVRKHQIDAVGRGTVWSARRHG